MALISGVPKEHFSIHRAMTRGEDNAFTADFGDPKFGTTASNPAFVGRRVDLIGRSIQARSFSDPVEVLRQYLRTQPTTSAKFLAEKAMVLLEPAIYSGLSSGPSEPSFGAVAIGAPSAGSHCSGTSALGLMLTQ